MKTNIEIELDDWNPEDEGFQEFIKEEVVASLARQLRDVHMNKVMDEVAKRCVAEAQILITESISNLFNKGVDLDGVDQPMTMQDMVTQKIEEWRSSKNPSGINYNNNRIPPLEMLLENVIRGQLKKDTDKLLAEVKNDAIKQARQTISDTLAVKPFDGKSLPY